MNTCVEVGEWVGLGFNIWVSSTRVSWCCIDHETEQEATDRYSKVCQEINVSLDTKYRAMGCAGVSVNEGMGDGCRFCCLAGRCAR